MKYMVAILVSAFVWALPASAQDDVLKIYISVDMEGIGGIGDPPMTGTDGKDYNLGRALMTEEVNTVVAAIFAAGPADILINDSHGSHHNLLHTQLDVRVRYIQGHQKILGMVEGLDDTFDAAIFIGYHARAGTERGFIAHTGSGAVAGLWLNGIEVGEGGMNAAFAGMLGVPVIMASGDDVFADQFADLTGALTVTTKIAITANAAELIHPEVVRERLAEATAIALEGLDDARTLDVGNPVHLRMQVSTTIRADVLMAIPGMRRVDGTTVEYDGGDMREVYPLIRLMYKFIRP